MTPEEIKTLITRATSRTANFKRVDLQIHSDDSTDYPRSTTFGDVSFNPGAKDKRPLAPRAILDAARDKKLDLIAVTDHMKSRRSCEIASLPAKGVVALPAIEVAVRLTQVSSSSKDAVHLLCIFKEGNSSEDIERIFQGAKRVKPYAERKSADAIDVDLSNFVENVHKYEGICVASHVNAEKGLRRAFFSLSDMKYVLTKRQRYELEKQVGTSVWNQQKSTSLEKLKEEEKGLADEIQNTYLEFLVNAGIDAVQIQQSTEGQFYRGEHCQALGIRPISAVLTSDAHCLDAIGYEQKITYVKMTRPCWEDLRLALKDPITRVRYADTVGTHAYTKIKGIVFVTNEGFFKPIDEDGSARPQVFGFADNLTCIIGGRGSGKSATIDALRYVFKDKAEVEALPPNLRKDVYARLKHTLTDTTIYLLLEAEDGEEVMVNTFYTGWESKNYESRFLTGEEAGIDLSTSTKYRAEIYGWNEIETLGTDSRKQLHLLDKFIEGLKELVDSIQKKGQELRANRAAVMESARLLESHIPEVKVFDEVQSAYKKVNTKAMQKLFADLDKILDQEKLLADLLEGLEEIEGDLALEDDDLEERLTDLSGQIGQKTVRSKIFGKEDARIHKAVKGYDAALGELAEIKKALQEELNHNRNEKSRSLKNLSRKAGFDDVKNLASVEKRLAQKRRYGNLVAQKQRIEKERSKVYTLLKQRKGILKKFRELQSQRSHKRENTKDSINRKLLAAVPTGPRIEIAFSPLGDREDFERRLGKAVPESGTQQETGLLKGVGLRYMDRRFAEIISSFAGPSDFVEKILEREPRT